MNKIISNNLLKVIFPLIAVITLNACSMQGGAKADSEPLSCNEDLKQSLSLGDETSVNLVKAFKKGEPLNLTGEKSDKVEIAKNDLCLVKLNVGPGNPGSENSLSTSKGIGIEIWLPTHHNWNNRLHIMGGRGWNGGKHGFVNEVANYSGIGSPATVAATEGAVTASSDYGHYDPRSGGSFAMLPDGTINKRLLEDFSSRAVYQLVAQTKAVSSLYYGKEAAYSYFYGFSSGGREALKLVQEYPDAVDGIISGSPAINWSKFITAGLYAQIVFQRDLNGVPLSVAQQDLLSDAAIKSCDKINGQHLGFILDPTSCHYDPTKDRNVLCKKDGGVNTSPHCVTFKQANTMNKIWYGQTRNGSVPNPAKDNGVNVKLKDNQLWYGPSRGTQSYISLGPLNLNTSPKGPFYISADQVALVFQDSTLATPNFSNETGNGSDGWKKLSYSDLANAYDKGLALQSDFNFLNSDNSDLKAFKARGGKVIHYHGLADEIIMPMGSVNYYERVVREMGGFDNTQDFYRFYLLPGVSHLITDGMINGTSNHKANVPAPNLDKFYSMLTQWVENDIAPESFIAKSTSSSLPICVYPEKITHKNGDIFKANSYFCN